MTTLNHQKPGTQLTLHRQCAYLKIKGMISTPNFTQVHTKCLSLGFTGLNLAAVAQD